jgi:dihydrofolate synthase/folylpolyglutamate synthase
MLAGLRVLYPAAERLRKDPELRPSFFDVTTVLGLLLFRRAGVDGAVVEVGLGGRLDSTNAVEARVSVITSIELEHAAMLGGTLAAIAGEKAGILRTGVPVVHGPLPAEALSVILARAIATDCEVEDVEARAVELRTDGVRFVLPDGRRIVAGVLGRHQATNSALAVRATERWLGRSLTGDEIGALEGVRLPARLERIGDAVLDSAHTPESARALRETLRALYPERRWVAVVSIATDKDAAALLRQLAPATHAIVLCRAEPVRSRDPEALVEEARACGIGRVEVVEEPRAALERARAHLLPGDLLVVTGSFYLAGALRTPLRGG